MKSKRLLALILSLSMAFTFAWSNVALAEETEPETDSLTQLEIEELDGSDVSVDLTREAEASELDNQMISPDAAVKVIIVMEGDSVIEENSSAVLDSSTEAKVEDLEETQNAVVSEIESAVLNGEALDVAYQYTWLLNGVAATVPYGTISDIQAIDGVKHVLLQRTYTLYEEEPITDISYPMTISDGVMIGRENTWAEGYTGAGVKIAIIDSGIDTDHPNFQALGEDVAVSSTVDTIDAVLTSLNAYSKCGGSLTAEELYQSSKIAYAFDYGDNDTDVNHRVQDGVADEHGTHVAGIAAANKVEGSDVVGVAPDAQLYIMKVSDSDGIMYDEYILAALEDALILGADVVNMSLGSSAGFTTDGEEIDAIYGRAAATGTILSIAAGNSYTAGYQNAWGTNENLTENPDNSVVSSPATYTNVLSVASVENAYYPSVYISANGYNIGYTDGVNGVNAPLSTLFGQELSIVAVPNVGDTADYEGLDVEGKIALVQRGVISFAEKCTNAANAGAAACLIYNNESGIINMALDDCTAAIPCASISMNDGAYLISALNEDPKLTVSVGDGETLIASPTAYEMSDFSSWGIAPDLTMEPDITAPGGNIYSTLDGGTYGLMSGTSMATPNVSGLSALVVQYVKENYGLAGEELHNMVNTLLMSTSSPLSYDEDLYYSPRKQGSGLADAYNAVTTPAYLSVDGCDMPKAELGDDSGLTGNYHFAFDVNNTGDSDLFYSLNTVAQTEAVDDAYEAYGLYFMASAPRALAASASEASASMVLRYDVDDNGETGSHDAYWIYQAAVAGQPIDENWTEVSFRYNLDGNETVDALDVQAYLDALVYNDSPADLSEQVLRVASGDTATVSVDVVLDASDKEYFNTYFENGCYVEGYTFLTALNAGGIDLSLPYLGFYGDWTEAPIIDSGFFWQREDERIYSQYVNCLFTQFNYYGYELGIDLGMNPYLEEDIDLSHLSLSPNGDGYAENIYDIYVSLLRNAAEITYTYKDAQTGEVYYEETLSHISKSVYYASYDQIIPHVYSWYGSGYDLTDENGDALPNNTKLILSVSAVVDYEGAEPDVWETPITIDTEAPKLLNAVLNEGSDGTRTLELTFQDNVSVAAVNLLNGSGTTIYGQYAVEDVEPDENGCQTYTVSYDVTDYHGKLMIILGDYAFNETYYGINLGGSGASYGNFVGFHYDDWGGDGSWISFDSEVDGDEISLFTSGLNFVCAEYVNGLIYAQTSDGKLYGFLYEDMLTDSLDLETTYITTLENVYQDLAYNYMTGDLYGLYVYADDWGTISEVYSINLKGEYFDENAWTTFEPYHEEWRQSRSEVTGLALACDDEGSVYILATATDRETGEDSTAQLWKSSWETAWGSTFLSPFELIGDTGLNMNYLQSMTWDHNTETLWWAQFYPVSLTSTEAQLVQIDPETAKATICGTLSGETGCLFVPLSQEAAEREEHLNVPDTDRETAGRPILTKSLITLTVGSSETLACNFDPWYSQYKDVTWTSDDESIAVVDQNGTVTAVAPGTCTVTAASTADPTLTAECAVSVTALDVTLEGITSVTSGGVGATNGSYLYRMTIAGGKSDLVLGNPITASEDLYFGLDIASATMAKGYIWACEYGNTGMLYQIDPSTGEVVDALQPIDGDMMFGLTYSENTGLFTAASNTDLYVDMPLTHEAQEEMLNSYDEELHLFTWHRLNVAQYLDASDQNFNTGEAGEGSMVDIVISGITAIDRTYTYEDTYKDYLGNWAYGGSVSYTSDVTFVLLDNVGRLWYIDEITGLALDEYGEAYSNEDGSCYISASRNGVLTQDNGDGTCSVFYIRSLEETPLTDMYRAGNMPRITYHFSDIYYAGTDENGGDSFLFSLYDYWNDGSSNQIYLYFSGITEMDWDTWEEVTTGRALYDLGSTGEGNIITTITGAALSEGQSATGNANQEEASPNRLYTGYYGG